MTTEVLLHVLALSVFVESLAAGEVSIGRVLAVVALGTVVLRVAAHPERRLLPDPRVGLPAAGLALWLFVGAFWSTSMSAWAGALLQLALGLSYFAAFAVLLESADQVRRVLMSFVTGASVFAVVGLAQATQGVRAVGLQGDPNTFALYEVCAVPVAVTLAGRATGLRRAAWFAVAALLLAAVVGAQSRGGLVAAVAVVLWLAVAPAHASARPAATPGRRRRTLAAGLAAVAAVVAVAVTAVPRFDPQTVAEDRGTGRLEIWSVAWRAWAEEPVLGIGPGGFEARSSQLLSHAPGVRLNPHSVIFDGIRVHNAYLEPWVEQGVVGLALYVAVLMGAGAILFRVGRRPGAGLLSACLPMLVAFVAATVFLSALNNKVLWMLVGFAGALPLLGQPRGPERPAVLREVSWTG